MDPVFSMFSAPWDTAVTTEGINPELTEATVMDLRPAKAYNLRMFAINSVGMSEASNVLTIPTKEAGTVLTFVVLILCKYTDMSSG